MLDLAAMRSLIWEGLLRSDGPVQLRAITEKDVNEVGQFLHEI